MAFLRLLLFVSNLFYTSLFLFAFQYPTADGEFILAFARRNVSIDKVHRAAEQRGLEWRIVDEHAEGVAGVEPVFAYTWKK